MKLILAGGRHYRFDDMDWERLRLLNPTEIVCGGATGADECGRQWAIDREIPVKTFPADWAKHRRAAGPIRNRQMAEYADAVALFPGGKGTESMYNEAVKAGLTIYDYRKGTEPQEACTGSVVHAMNWCPDCDRNTPHVRVSAHCVECVECGELQEK